MIGKGERGFECILKRIMVNLLQKLSNQVCQVVCRQAVININTNKYLQYSG